MDSQINRIITVYKNKLEKSGISVEKMILFGSHAKNQIHENSDIDLVVVSDDFRDMDLWERSCLLGRARVGIYHAMDIKGITQKELEEAEQGSFIHDEVLMKGLEV